MPKPRHRAFTMLELRADIVDLAEFVGKNMLLVSAVTKTLKKMYPEKYKDLIPNAVLECPVREGRVATKRFGNRWWITVAPVMISERKIKVTKKHRKLPDIIKCKHCGRYVEKEGEWQVRGIKIGEYTCKHCGTRNTVRSDIEEEKLLNELEKFGLLMDDDTKVAEEVEGIEEELEPESEEQESEQQEESESEKLYHEYYGGQEQNSEDK